MRQPFSSTGERIMLATTAAERGGVWKHVIDLAVALREAGHQVKLAVPAEAAALTTDARRHEFHVTDLNASTASDARVWHLHLPKPFDRRTLRLLVAARSRGKRTFVTEHLPRHPSSDRTLAWDPHLTGGIRKPGAQAAKTLVKRAEASIADQVITVSQSSRSFLMRRFGLKGDRCSAVVNGVAYSPAVPLPDLRDGLRVLAIGTASVRKGHDLIIEAALRSTGSWTVDIFGAGPELPMLRGMAEATGGRVVFRGWTDQTAQEIDSHHLLCMPSRYEPLGYAAVEAMIRGRPVVAAEVDGLTEVVLDGVTGRLVPPGDAGAVARALDEIAADPTVLQKWAAASHERARDHFALTAMVDQVTAIYGTFRTPR